MLTYRTAISSIVSLFHRSICHVTNKSAQHWAFGGIATRSVQELETRVLLGGRGKRFWRKARASLTLQVTRNVILDLVVPRRAQEQGAVHQGELLEHGQRSVAKCTVDHVPLACAEGRQDKPAEQVGKMIRLRNTEAVGRQQVATQECCHRTDVIILKWRN